MINSVKKQSTAYAKNQKSINKYEVMSYVATSRNCFIIVHNFENCVENSKTKHQKTIKKSVVTS